MATQVFDIPSSGGMGWLTSLLLLPLVIGIALAIAFWPRPLRVEVTPAGLQIRGSVYGRSVPRSEWQLDRARVVDLAAEPELKPIWRSNGVGWPNYRVGWFRLRDQERALCFLTSTQSVLYLPTTQNYALLISSNDAAALLTALKSAG